MKLTMDEVVRWAAQDESRLADLVSRLESVSYETTELEDALGSVGPDVAVPVIARWVGAESDGVAEKLIRALRDPCDT